MYILNWYRSDHKYTLRKTILVKNDNFTVQLIDLNLLTKSKDLLSFYSSAKTYYRIHSPYIFDLIESILEDDNQYYAFENIEHLRKELSENNSQIQVEDYGAGSSFANQGSTRVISKIANSAVSPKYQCEVLFKLIKKIKPENSIELGTSLGISTLYIANAYLKGKITSIEGSKSIAQIADQNFKSQSQKNIILKIGKFDDHLPLVLKDLNSIDFAYIDGNHQYKASIEYFEAILPYTNENSILLFDDIYWSTGMKKAWEEIKAYDAVTQSIDLYYFGIIFFRKSFKQKEHHKVLKAKFKPWQKYI